jgi:hypothetical protein
MSRVADHTGTRAVRNSSNLSSKSRAGDHNRNGLAAATCPALCLGSRSRHQCGSNRHPRVICDRGAQTTTGSIIGATGGYAGGGRPAVESPMVCRRAIPHRSRVVRDELPLDRRPQIRPALRADQHDLRLAGRRHWSRPRHRPNSDAQGTGLFQRAKRRFVATDVAQCAAADGQDTCLLPGDPAGRDLGAGVARGGRYRCRARRSAGSPLTGRAVLVLLLSRTRRPGCRCGLRLGWFPPPVAHIRRGHRGGKAPSAFNLANKPLTNDQEAGPDDSKPASDLAFLVGDTGLEPVTSSVSAAVCVQSPSGR